MDKSNFLRMQLIMQDSKAASFNTNLRRMISMLIYSKKMRLTIEEIKDALLNQYDLVFTVDEIKKVIEYKNSGIVREKSENTIERHGKTFKTVEYYYKLDDKTYSKYEEKSRQFANEDLRIIERFKEYASENDYEIDSQDFKLLLNKFLYHIFNSNKETLLLFLNARKTSFESSSIELTEDEKRDINLFLNWDDDEKNSYIYKVVSYCVEYCLLTVKKGGNNYKNVFNGKKFYLDTNVILRLAGINNEERKLVTSSFINKCRENGIEILYTNFTYNEIQETVRYNLGVINNMINGYRMVNKNHVAYYSKPTTNLDFINLYDEWVKRNAAKYNDFQAFYKDIMRTINSILREFKREDGLSNEKINSEQYYSLVNSLQKYKSLRYAKAHEQSVKIDIENYLYVKNRRDKGKVDSLYDIKEYLISTDGNFCDWGKEVYEAVIPIVVLPSVWYSLLLKLSGRTENDFKSFNLFLNQRYKMGRDDLADKKEEILHLIQSLDESVDIKDLMLDEIKTKIDGKQPDEIIVSKVVDEARESVINKKAEELFDQKQEQLVSDTELKTYISTIEIIAENRASTKIARINTIKVLFSGMLRLITVIVVIFFIIKIYKSCVTLRGGWKKYKDIFDEWYDLISFFVLMMLNIVIKPIYSHIERKYTYSNIKEKELRRLKMDYSKSTQVLD